MKKLTSSIVAMAALSGMSFAGGDIIAPVFEQETVSVPVEPAYVPAPVEEYVAPAEEYSAPAETYTSAPAEEYFAPAETYTSAPAEEYVAPAETYAPAATQEYVAPAATQEYVAPAATQEYVAPAATAASTPAKVETASSTVAQPASMAVAPVLAKALGLYIAGGLTGIAAREQHDDSANLFSEEHNQDRQVVFTGRLGYYFMNYLGAELRGTYGITPTDNHSDTKFKQVGVYLKPNYDFNNINLYGLLGYAKANMNDWNHLGSTETGFSYGAGLGYQLPNSKVSVFSDVLNYLTEDDSMSQWGMTVGASYQF